jgi:hypothetical protein
MDWNIVFLHFIQQSFLFIVIWKFVFIQFI